MGRKRTPEEEARRELIRELLSNANVIGVEPATGRTGALLCFLCDV